MTDNAPVRNTCPTIDNVIYKIETAIDEAESIIKKLSEALREMETIRDDNTTLREWGNEQYDRAETAEAERDEFLEKIYSRSL
jgi:chaperonin cofactor prefoldin